MRFLLTVILVSLAIGSTAQILDSDKFRSEVERAERGMESQKESPVPKVNWDEAQQSINSAGKDLRISRTMFFIGIGCSILGGSLLGIGASTSDPNNRRIFTGVGAGLAIGGNAVTLTAFIPIGNAGRKLEMVRFK